MSVSSVKRVVVLGDPDKELAEPFMEFRLTYKGLLLSTQDADARGYRDGKAPNKHQIRKHFHGQLKRLWNITPFLKTGERSGASARLLEGGPDHPDYKIETLSKIHARHHFEFVPLVTKSLGLLCALDILFLRPGSPSAMQGETGGDLDNRIKTLIDALAIPDDNQAHALNGPQEGETPFFVLLEDDRLVSKLTVETDELLDWDGKNVGQAELVITVRARPRDMTLGNMQFA